MCWCPVTHLSIVSIDRFDDDLPYLCVGVGGKRMMGSMVYDFMLEPSEW